MTEGNSKIQAMIVAERAPKLKIKCIGSDRPDEQWLAEKTLNGKSLKCVRHRKTDKNFNSALGGMMWRRAEKSTPILGELREEANLQQCTNPGSHEEALMKKEQMNLRRSFWKFEEGKTTNMRTPENYNRKWPGREI